MPIVLRPLAADSDLAALTRDIRQIETLGFELVSIAAGHMGGLAANLATFRDTPGPRPARPIQLEAIDGSLGQDDQEARLIAPGRECVCYGTLFVSTTPRNVAAFR
jgi:hypothetical protein